MIEIGGRPILWHIMRYYAGWVHNESVLCLGYKGDVVKEYFLTYNAALFNDFVLERIQTASNQSPRDSRLAGVHPAGCGSCRTPTAPPSTTFGTGRGRNRSNGSV
jgi:hypothetical protein